MLPSVKHGGALPPPDTPWHEVYGALSKRAAHGDARAASRLYQDLERCLRYGYALDSAKVYLASTGSIATMSEWELKANLKGAGALASTLADGRTVCRDTSPQELSKVRYAILLQAAKTGDQSARACFVDGPFDTSEPAPGDKRLKEYRSYAAQFMREGIADGDWRMVIALATWSDRTSRPFAPLWKTRIFPDKPRKAYLYTAVQLLGADAAGDTAEKTRLRSAMTEIARRIRWTRDEQYATLQKATDIYQAKLSSSPHLKSGDIDWCSP